MGVCLGLVFGWGVYFGLWFCRFGEKGVLKIINAEVMIDGKGFTQRSGAA